MYILVVILALIAGFILPAWALRLFIPAIESSSQGSLNFHGRSVVLGLGAVWLVWMVTTRLAALVLELGRAWSSVGVSEPIATTLSLASDRVFSAVPLLLLSCAFAFGLLDDVFGTSAEKGYRGHLRALKQGRLTTGAMKLFGVGAASLIAGASIAYSLVIDRLHTSLQAAPTTFVATWALATLTIGLSANLLNLLDLRPGRALKSYIILVIPLSGYFIVRAAEDSGAILGVGAYATLCVAILAVLFGPAVAAWRFDLGERAMLGDAGSNVMGAIVGYLLASVLSLWAMLLVAIVLLALNLLSERVSFSRIIETNALLSWVDGWGRLPEER